MIQLQGCIQIKGRVSEFPLWLRWFRTRHCLCEDVGSILGLAPCVKDPVLLLLWLWRRPAAAALIRPLAGSFYMVQVGL